MDEPAWKVAAYAVASFLLSLLIARRSQVDAWAESNPRIAGAMKILRGTGIDPWLIAQGLTLVVAGRLPKWLRPPAPESTGDRPTPTDPPRRPPAGLIGLLLIALGSCSAAPPQGPPCDQATLAGIVAECAVRVDECAGSGVPEEQCAAIAECDAKLDARAEACR